MSLKDFYKVPNVPVVELLLDTGNPRIRHGSDQKDCIARLLRRSRTFMNLLRDIAINGLSIEHLVITRNNFGKWVVRDGNRRIAALQLLNEPGRCPDPVLRQEIQRLAAEYPENILTHIDCIASDNEEAVLRYLELKHTGANEGIGQESWSALTKAIFNVSHGLQDQNKRAVQLIMWAEEQGIRIEDDFPLTNLNRMINQNTLRIIGFKVEDDKLMPIIDTESARRIVERIIKDLESQVVKVNDIFTPEQQIDYVKKIRREIFPEDPICTTTENKQEYREGQENENRQEDENGQKNGNKYEGPLNNGHSQQTQSINGNEEANTSGEKATSPPSGNRPQRHRSPKKPSWDRKCIFPGGKPGFNIPEKHSKAYNIVVELRKLNVKETPIAVAFLLRALIELSEGHYRQEHKLPEKDKFNKKIAAAAEHMANRGEITNDQKEVIIRRTREEEGILHVTTLHKYVHSPDFHPSAQIINTLWDEIGFFVEQCWRI